MTGRLGFQALVAALLLAACSDFFGEGPDPSRAGRFMSGGAGGSGGSNGGSGGYCRFEGPLPDVLVQNGAGCPDIASCVQSQCPSAVSCLGTDIRRLDFSGSACPKYMDCIATCQCDPGCLSACRPDTDNCPSCLGSIFSCTQAYCSGSPCQGSGGSGGGGFGPVILVNNLNTNVNDLAVDDTHVYFATQQGLAKVPKAGASTATPLGAYANLTALAIRGDFIYVVKDSGEVTRLKKDGTDAQAIVPSSFGGGSGPIVLDATSIFYVVGPYLRRAPLEGGSSTELAMDVWSQGGPPTPRRLALDTAHVYFVGGGFDSAALRMIDKTATAGPGTPIATPNGDARAVVASGGEVFFAELGSDGLTTELRIKALPAGGDAGTSTVIATHRPPDGNNSGYLGNGFTTDGTNLYFGGSPGIFSVSIADRTMETLDAYARPGALEVDDEFVYYAEQMSGTSIRKIAKN